MKSHLRKNNPALYPYICPMPHEEYIIKSWSELCEAVFQNSWQEALGRFRTDYAFRGISDASVPLVNRFVRTCGDNPKLEYHLLRNFRKYARAKDSRDLSSDWRTLTIGQHYGLPTRLIDWTYSPFVAIHFATGDLSKFHLDGAIWMVDFVKVNRLLPVVLRDVLENVGSNTFTIEMLEEAVPGLNDFENLSTHDLALFFEPPSLDDRIINQYAFFSVMSKATAQLDIWLENHPQVFKRIIIPAALKWEVRDKLDQANINERLLFPGLDGLANWLARHYSPRG
jgi:hypothetical protein